MLNTFVHKLVFKYVTGFTNFHAEEEPSSNIF